MLLKKSKKRKRMQRNRISRSFPKLRSSLLKRIPKFCPTARCAEFTFRQRRSRRCKREFSDKAVINNKEVRNRKVKADIKVKDRKANKVKTTVKDVRLLLKASQTPRSNFLLNRLRKRARAASKTPTPVQASLTISQL